MATAEEVQEVQPSPLPTRVEVAQAQARQPDGQPVQFLVMRISTPAGQTTVFFDRAMTERVASLLAQQLANWPAGLLVPQVDMEQIRRRLVNGTRN